MNREIKIGDTTLTYEIPTDKRFAVITGVAKDATGAPRTPS